MNKDRRAALEEVRVTLEEMKATLGGLRDEEQEYIDNMPEGLAGGEKSTNAENAVSSMDTAIENLDEAASSIGDAAA